MTKADLRILIPAFNEEKGIGPLLEKLKTSGFQCVVLDDGSSDQTPERARAQGALVLPAFGNQGKGAAIRRGFEWFLSTDAKAAVLMDADGQHDPRDLDKFLEALNQADAGLVLGNRMDAPQDMPWLRRATNKSLSWIISRISGQKIPDSQCGYRAIRREALSKIKLRTDRFEIESEMLLEISRCGFRIVSVPVRCVYAGEGSHIQPLRDTVRFFSFLFRYLSKKN